jgi:hypothetical protein
MGNGLAQAEALATALHQAPAGVCGRLLDQLWLRVVLIEQRKRVNRDERTKFDARADRVLALLDPPSESCDPEPNDELARGANGVREREARRGDAKLSRETAR